MSYTVRKKQSGFTLTEVAIVLGVVGVILGGIWSYASTAWENAKQEKLSEELYAIAKNVQSYFLGRNGFDYSVTATSPQLIGQGVIPGDMIVPTTPNPTIVSPWGINLFMEVCGVDASAIQKCKFTGGPFQYFAITIYGLTPERCIKAITRNAGIGVPIAPVDVWTTDNNGNNAANNGLSNKRSWVLDDGGANLGSWASTWCQSLKGGHTTKTISFVYRLQPSS